MLATVTSKTNKSVTIGGLYFWWASGTMDNVSDYGSEDSRFDSWLARSVLVFLRLILLLCFFSPKSKRKGNSLGILLFFPKKGTFCTPIPMSRGDTDMLWYCHSSHKMQAGGPVDSRMNNFIATL